MNYVFRIVGRDAYDVSKFFGGLLVLILGYVGCIAVGNLVANLFLGRFDLGVSQFGPIMNLDGVPLPDQVRSPLGFINWGILGVLVIWFIHASIRRYLVSIRERAHVAKLKETTKLARRSMALAEQKATHEEHKRVGNGE